MQHPFAPFILGTGRRGTTGGQTCNDAQCNQRQWDSLGLCDPPTTTQPKTPKTQRQTHALSTHTVISYAIHRWATHACEPIRSTPSASQPSNNQTHTFIATGPPHELQCNYTPLKCTIAQANSGSNPHPHPKSSSCFFGTYLLGVAFVGAEHSKAANTQAIQQLWPQALPSTWPKAAHHAHATTAAVAPVRTAAVAPVPCMP